MDSITNTAGVRREPIGRIIGRDNISDGILPALRKAGVREDQIEQMLIRNPRAIFQAGGSSQS